MLQSLSTKATVAKIHAMHGKMLTKQNYQDLMHKQTVNEIAAYLKKNTRYKDILATIDVNTIHRGLLENLIRKKNFNTYVSLCNFQHLGEIPFFNFEVKRGEIEQILSCILHINAGKTEEYIQTLPSYLMKHASFDMIELAKSKSFSDVLKVIHNTVYYDDLKLVKPDNNGQIDCLRCEVLLRTTFYDNLMKTIDKDFNGSTAKELKKSVMTQIDLINFINSYRMKAFYKAPPAKIKQYMLPFYGRMKKTQMNAFYEAKSDEEMIGLFKKTIYANKIENIDPDILENNISFIRYKSASGALQNAQSAPVALYSFSFLCEVEAMNIVSIIEGIRYKASPGFIEKLIII